MKLKLSLLLLVLLSQLWGNSIFSKTGFPNMYFGNDVYGIGMGNSGISDIFRVNTNYTNPSLVTTANKVIFSTAVTLGNTWYSDSSGNGFKADGLNFPYFTIAIPVSNHKFAFSYNNFLSGDLENHIEEISYEEINRIDANMYKTSLIYAYKNRFVNFGLAGNYYIGHRTKYWEYDFDDESFNDSKYELEKKYMGESFSCGINKKIGNLAFSINYSSDAELTGDSFYKYNFEPYQDTLDTKSIYRLPRSISGGLTARFFDKYKTSIDLNCDFWENLDGYDHNTFKASAGFAYDPLSGYQKWYKKIPFRLGYYYRILPFKKNNSKIEENTFSFGLSIPLKSSGKKIDLAVQYLIRGDISVHGIRDKSLMFTIGVTGFDIFQKRPKKIEPREIPEADR